MTTRDIDPYDRLAAADKFGAVLYGRSVRMTTPDPAATLATLLALREQRPFRGFTDDDADPREIPWASDADERAMDNGPRYHRSPL